MSKTAAFSLKLAALAMAILCLVSLWRVIAVIWLPLPLDPNEGWNAYHAAAAMAGSPLYPGPHSFMVNNYPPLSFYLVGALGRILGDNIIAGRIISLVSLGVFACGLFVAARRMGCKQIEAAFSSLFFVGGMLVFTDYVGMDDPQMLAHAVAIVGFVMLLHEPRQTSRIAAAAIMFVLAAFVKHNVIVMALAITGWLALFDRRAGLRLAVFGIVFALVGLALFRLSYGINLLAVLDSARTYTLDNFRDGLENWLRWALVPLLGVSTLVYLRSSDRYVQLCGIYAGIGVVLGACFLAGTGVDANVMFDADIALALGSALLFNRFDHRVWAAVVGLAAAASLFIAAWLNAGDDWRNFDAWLHPMRHEAQVAQSDIAFLELRRGPALCEMQSLCYWAHKPAAVDVFNIGEQFETGARSDEPIVELIEAHSFAVIQFDPDSPYSLGENVHNAVARTYRLHHEDEYGSFYVPR